MFLKISVHFSYNFSFFIYFNLLFCLIINVLLNNIQLICFTFSKTLNHWTNKKTKKWHTPLFQCDMVYIVRLITGLMLFYTSFITVNHIRLHATYSRYLVLMVTAVMRGEMREWWMVIVVLLLPNVWPAETLPPASRDVQSFAELTWRCQHTVRFGKLLPRGVSKCIQAKMWTSITLHLNQKVLHHSITSKVFTPKGLTNLTMSVDINCLVPGQAPAPI